MAKQMSLLKISSLYVECFEQILLHKNIKAGQLTRDLSLCPREFQLIVVDMLPKNHKDIVNEELQYCFYINFRVLALCVESEWSPTIIFTMTFPLLLNKQLFIMSENLVFNSSCRMVV